MLSDEVKAKILVIVQQHIRNQAAAVAAYQMILAEEQERRRRRRRKPRRPRRWWVKNWVARRPYLGAFETLMFELEIESPDEDFKEFLRIEPEMFYELVERLSPHIQKQRTRFREPICPPLRIAITLRFLATGQNLKAIAWHFRVAHNTISGIIKETVAAIIHVYANEVVKMPTTAREWLKIANDFAVRWQFPHCLGAIDGKHIALVKPTHSGTTFFNYKGFFSIVLMGICDADYKFIYAAVGAEGSLSDRAIFARMQLKEDMDNDNLNFPASAPLRGDDFPVPYYFIGDDAFPLTSHMMKPYRSRNLSHPDRVFNYRQCRARRVIENTYGILSCRWGVLLKTIKMSPAAVRRIVQACICLHNLMRIRYPTLQNDDLNQFAPGAVRGTGQWRNAQVMHEINQEVGPAAQRQGKMVRTYLKNYFQTDEGRVDWQDDMV